MKLFARISGRATLAKASDRELRQIVRSGHPLAKAAEAEIEKRNSRKYPAGAPGGKGGQFAPKEGGEGGGFAGYDIDIHRQELNFALQPLRKADVVLLTQGKNFQNAVRLGLATRGLDKNGMWIGFAAAHRLHKVTPSEYRAFSETDEKKFSLTARLLSTVSQLGNKALAVAWADRKHLPKIAKAQMADRGLGIDGEWVGFPQAKREWGV